MDPDLRELFSRASKLEESQWTSSFNTIPYDYYSHAWDTAQNIGIPFNFLVADYMGKEETLYNVVILYILIYYFNGFGTNNRVNFNNRTRVELENEIQAIFSEFHRILISKQSELPRRRDWKTLSQDKKILSVSLCSFQIEEHSAFIQSSLLYALKKKPTIEKIEILAFDIE